MKNSRDDYNFKFYAPFTQRGQNFPRGIIRVRRTSLVISSDIVEELKGKFAEGEKEFVRLQFGIDKKRNAITIQESERGYRLQCRFNGNAYLNTTRIGFPLTVGDYLVDHTANEWIFKLAV